MSCIRQLTAILMNVCARQVANIRHHMASRERRVTHEILSDLPPHTMPSAGSASRKAAVVPLSLVAATTTRSTVTAQPKDNVVSKSATAPLAAPSAPDAQHTKVSTAAGNTLPSPQAEDALSALASTDDCVDTDANGVRAEKNPRASHKSATVARDTGEAVFPKIMTKDRTKKFCMRIPVVRHLLYGQQVLCASLCQMTPVFVLPVAIGATKCW